MGATAYGSLPQVCRDIFKTMLHVGCGNVEVSRPVVLEYTPGEWAKVRDASGYTSAMVCYEGDGVTWRGRGEGMVATGVGEHNQMLVRESPGNPQWQRYRVGAGDLLISPWTRGGGTPIEIEFLTTDTPWPKTKTAVVQYVEPVRIYTGEATWGPSGEWGRKDVMSVEILMPATPVAANAGAGNVDLEDSGAGFSWIKQNTATIGSHDLTLADAVPIRTKYDDGDWDVDEETGNVTTTVTPGSGCWKLADTVEQTAKPVNGIRMGHKDERWKLPKAASTLYLHPKHKIRFSVTMESAPTVNSWWEAFVDMYRRYI